MSRVEENTKLIELTQEELAEIDGTLEKMEVQGGRAPERFAHLLDG